MSANRTEQQRRSQEGFTMAEILVALVLLTIVLTGSMAMQVTSIRAARDAQTTTAATTIALDRLEQLRSVPYANLTAMAATLDGCADYQGTTTSCPAFFSRTTTITLNASGIGFLCTVEVGWKTGSGSQSVTLSLERSP